MSDYNDLIAEVVSASSNMVSAYEWGMGTGAAARELEAARQALTNEFARLEARIAALERIIEMHGIAIP